MPPKKSTKESTEDDRPSMSKELVREILDKIPLGTSVRVQFYDAKADRSRERSDLQRDFKCYTFAEGLLLPVTEEYVTLGSYLTLEDESEALENEDYMHIPIGSIYYIGELEVKREWGNPVKRKWTDGSED